MSDAKKLIGEINGNILKLSKKQPETLKAFQGLVPAASKAGALDEKTKELIALGMAITSQCEPCIAFHISKALKLGATAEEISEVCSVAILMNGGPGLMYSAKTMGMLDDLMS